MIQILPENLSRHELIGLEAQVAAASNQSHIGISGRIIDETMKTFQIENHDQTQMVPKSGTTFEVKLPGGDYAVVEGNHLISRPSRRTQKAGGSIWH
ncbi:MAG: ribonuclease P protein component 1 [Halobacteriales archaeon]|tara:strand:+ start:291 stop:581 length:291 start_codon:yes stop_codon:yes gene_type:complete